MSQQAEKFLKENYILVIHTTLENRSHIEGIQKLIHL